MPGNATADVIIIGGGVMGCAAAYHLAKDGRRVLLLEQCGSHRARHLHHRPAHPRRRLLDGPPGRPARPRPAAHGDQRADRLLPAARPARLHARALPALHPPLPQHHHPGQRLPDLRPPRLQDDLPPHRAGRRPGRPRRLVRYAADVLPSLGGRVIEAVTCRYTMTPDEHFIIDRHPKFEQIVLASPCSGHGFKFGSVLGGILADLASYGRSAYPIARFQLGRTYTASHGGIGNDGSA